MSRLNPTALHSCVGDSLPKVNIVGKTTTKNQRHSDFRITIAFLVAAILRKFGNAIWIPFLLAFVTAADFSRYGMLLAAVSLLVPLLSLGIVFAPMRLAFDHPEGTARDSMFRTTLLATFGISGAGVAFLLPLIVLAIPEDPLTGGSWLLKCCIATQVFATILCEYAFSLLRVRGKALKFAFVACIYSFGPFVISIPVLWLSTIKKMLKRM